MQTFTIARDYEDEAGKQLQVFLRFGRERKLSHVTRRDTATLFLTHAEAETSCPRGYYVDPRAKSRGKGKVK